MKFKFNEKFFVNYWACIGITAKILNRAKFNVPIILKIPSEGETCAHRSGTTSSAAPRWRFSWYQSPPFFRLRSKDGAISKTPAGKGRGGPALGKNRPAPYVLCDPRLFAGKPPPREAAARGRERRGHLKALATTGPTKPPEFTRTSIH